MFIELITLKFCIAIISSVISFLVSYVIFAALLNKSDIVEELSMRFSLIIGFVVFLGLFLYIRIDRVLIKEITTGAWEDSNGHYLHVEPPTEQKNYSFDPKAPEGWRYNWYFRWEYTIPDPYDLRIGKKSKVIDKNENEILLEDGSIFSIIKTEKRYLDTCKVGFMEYAIVPACISDKDCKTPILLVREYNLK